MQLRCNHLLKRKYYRISCIHVSTAQTNEWNRTS